MFLDRNSYLEEISRLCQTNLHQKPSCLVDVHQVVRDLAGTILADEHVGHRFTIEQGLIRRMEVCPLPSWQKLSAHSRGVDAARE